MVKFHKILVGVSLMSILIASILIFINSGYNEYNPPNYYNSTSMEEFQGALDDMQTAANRTRSGINKITDPDNPFDVIGGFFTSGFGVLQTLTESFDTLFTVTSIGVGNIEGVSSEYSNLLITFIITAITLVIFVGIMVHQLTKSDRI